MSNQTSKDASLSLLIPNGPWVDAGKPAQSAMQVETLYQRRVVIVYSAAVDGSVDVDY